MSQSIHGQQTIQNTFHVHTPRKHVVPTHLNMPDQVLTIWSLGLSARQLLLLLVGCGLGGTLFQHLAILGHYGMPGEMLRLLLSLPPFLLSLLLAWYQYAGRYLEVWLVVLMRYRLRPKLYLWRSIRYNGQHLTPFIAEGDEPAMEDVAGMYTITIPAEKESP
jgi:PrgI family protein